MVQNKMIFPGTGRHQETREVHKVETLWEHKRSLRLLFSKSYKTEAS
jgi:hypothetical protein